MMSGLDYGPPAQRLDVYTVNSMMMHTENDTIWLRFDFNIPKKNLSVYQQHDDTHIEIFSEYY